MNYIKGVSREQKILFPEVVDDFITEDNPVRFIDAFVDRLNLDELGFQKSQLASTGRPPYHPGDLLKLYIYGYLNRVRSSRRLEKEAHRNIEVIWLLRKLRPDFKTIADFRKDSTKAFKQVFRQFILLCRKLDLFGGELIAIDGSKFKALNSKNRNFTKKKLKKRLEEIDAKIEKYLNELDAADEEEADVQKPTAEELKEKIRQLRERKDRYGKLKEGMETSGESQVSLTDPDSRLMARDWQKVVGYNVQAAVDDKHKLIVEQDVTNAVTDDDQLSGIAIRAKETLGVDQMKVVADMGYYHGDEIKTCEKEGIEPYVSKPLTSANRKLGLYGKEKFTYDSGKDCYICPGGQELTYRFEITELGRRIRYYATSTCRSCEKKPQCTRNKGGRRITRWVHEHILERMQEGVEANPELMKKRKQIVEHPFGTIKHWNDQGYFLMKGLKKVRAEMSLSTLAYNIKRSINILGVSRMIEALV
jgi:transposase